MPINMNKIRKLFVDNVFVEDNQLYIKNKFKYDFYNYLKEVDSEFIKKLHIELEYFPKLEKGFDGNYDWI